MCHITLPLSASRASYESLLAGNVGAACLGLRAMWQSHAWPCEEACPAQQCN